MAANNRHPHAPPTSLPRWRILLAVLMLPGAFPANVSANTIQDHRAGTGWAAAPCSTIPNPGPTMGPTETCPTVEFYLELQNYGSGDGITYQWEISTDGNTWTDAPGNSTGYDYIASQLVDTRYRCQVTCNMTGTGISIPLLVTTNEPLTCYCETFFSLVEPICHVGFADISNDSPSEFNDSPYLEDFTYLTAHVEPGHSYIISATGNTNSTFRDHITAFFDWDIDGVFETIVYLGYIEDDLCVTQIYSPVVVPTDAKPGLSRFRVAKCFNEPVLIPCSNYGWGQAEDYSVVVAGVSGIADHQASPGIALHPNPASTELHLTTADGLPVDVQVYDMLGQLVLVQQRAARINVHGLAPGSYNLHVVGDDHTVRARARFVKQ